MLQLSLLWVRFWGDALGYQGAGGQGLPQHHSPIWDEQYTHHIHPHPRPKSLWEPVTEL